MRHGSTPSAKSRGQARHQTQAPAVEHDPAVVELRRQLAAARAARVELEAVLGAAIEALAHNEAVLTFLQESLGVKSSPRVEAIRRAKAQLKHQIEAGMSAAGAATSELA